MIADYNGDPRYYDKPWNSQARTVSPELKRLYIEIAQNPNYHISRECSFYPRGFPSHSPGWGIGY